MTLPNRSLYRLKHAPRQSLIWIKLATYIVICICDPGCVGNIIQL